MIWRGLLLFVVMSLCACHHENLHDAQGRTIDASQWKNKWVFINVWAPWCHPCRQEIPDLNRFANAHAGQVLVLGYNFDGPKPELLKKQIGSLNIHFKVLIEDPSRVFSLKPSGVVPTTYVIGPDGRVVQALIGPQTFQGLEKFLKQQVAKQSKEGA